QAAAIDKSTVAAIAPAVSSHGPPVLTEVRVAPRDDKVPAERADIEASDKPSAFTGPAHSTKAARSTARQITRPEKRRGVTSAVHDWKTAILQEIKACRTEKFPSRIACVEHVRWKHCAPDRWNTIPACAAKTSGVPLVE